jgi:hypothetical protein
VTAHYGDQFYVDEVRKRLVAAKEWVFNRGWQQDPPNFKSVRGACERLLAAYPSAQTILTFRCAVLRVLREMVLEHGLNLVVPCKGGSDVFHIPRSVLFNNDGTRKRESLAIHPPPAGSKIYTGPVDVVVTGCLGFNPNERRLYALDNENGAYLLDEWREGLANGFRFPSNVPVAAIASDAQEISGWPDSLRSFLRADYVFTPSRTVRLGLEII